MQWEGKKKKKQKTGLGLTSWDLEPRGADRH